jgi:hypothetical protein
LVASKVRSKASPVVSKARLKGRAGRSMARSVLPETSLALRVAC